MSLAANTKINELLIQLMKVGWSDLLQTHFTVANATDIDMDLVDWLVRGEINNFCQDTDVRNRAWKAVQRDECSLNKVLHFLRKSDGDVNFTDKTGQTLLHVFLRSCSDYLPQKKSLKVVKLLLGLGASVDAVDGEDETPLHIAAEKMKKALMRLMLPSFTNVVAASGFSADTVLHDVVYACEKDEAAHEGQYTDIARVLVGKGADPNAANESGITALQLAVEYKFYEMLRIFRTNGADFQLRTSDDETLLHLACTEAKNSANQLKIIDLLVAEGCDVNAKDRKGRSPLHRAAKLRCARVVERLIQLGGDVNWRAKKLDVTPLHVAAKFNEPNNVDVLLGAGAHVDAEDANGVTPLHLAASRDGLKTAKSLIGRGADVHRRERTFGFTPLHFAASGCKKKVELLLRRGAKVNVSSSDGVTPLHLAAWASNAKVVKVLIERGADVNCRGGALKMTSLHLASMWDNANEAKTAIFKGEDLRDSKFHGMWVASLTMDRDYVAVAEMLVTSGGDVNAKDATGRTPLHLATLRQGSDIGEYETGGRCAVDLKRAFAALTSIIYSGDMVEPLLTLGAHVDEVDDEGRSPARNVLMSGNVKGLKCLLKFGLDVNDDDVKVEGGDDKVVGFLMKYVTKLKILGLPVKADYDCSKSEEDAQHYVELEMFKSRLIDGSDVTLYDFLRMKARRRATFAKKVTTMDLKDEFPEFHDVIEASCKRAVNRAKLLGPAVSALREVTRTWWPEICVERILSGLNDRHLRNLIASAKVSV